MPTYQATEVEPFDMIPEGSIVAAKVKSIEDIPDMKFPMLEWKFTVIEPGPFEGYTIKGRTSQKFAIHEKAKLTQWSGAILGRQFEVGDGLNTDDLYTLPCRILIEWEPDKNDPERHWMRVGDVMPPRGGKGADAVFG